MGYDGSDALLVLQAYHSGHPPLSTPATQAYLPPKPCPGLPTTQELGRIFEDRIARPRSIGAIGLPYIGEFGVQKGTSRARQIQSCNFILLVLTLVRKHNAI